MQVWLYTLISVFIISLISFVGVFAVFFKEEKLKKISLFIVSFAVGALFGDVFIHILPESFKDSGASLKISLLLVAGILIFFMLEKFLRWRHCHVPISKSHYHPVVSMNLFGDAIHNFIDGMLIAASFIVSVPLGVATALAIAFHEIPQEFGDFGMLIHGGMSRKIALFYNFLSALVGIFGAAAVLLIGQSVQNFALILLPITAGGFLYIAGSDLIPELHQDVGFKTSFLQLFSIIFGVAVMALLTLMKS